MIQNEFWATPNRKIQVLPFPVDNAWRGVAASITLLAAKRFCNTFHSYAIFVPGSTCLEGQLLGAEPKWEISCAIRTTRDQNLLWLFCLLNQILPTFDGAVHRAPLHGRIPGRIRLIVTGRKTLNNTCVCQLFWVDQPSWYPLIKDGLLDTARLCGPFPVNLNKRALERERRTTTASRCSSWRTKEAVGFEEY